MMSTIEIRLPGLVALEHSFAVPLDHSSPQSPTIEVFARELADPDGREKPFLVFFQGGPGYEASRPTRLPNGPGWVDRALKDFRVLMLDQRGTGRSTPVGFLEACRLLSRRSNSRTSARPRSCAMPSGSAGSSGSSAGASSGRASAGCARPPTSRSR